MMRRNHFSHRSKCATTGMVFACVAITFLFYCRNPFFPSTGYPVDTPGPRSTPRGVLQQLMKAYESKRLELFEELLPADSTYRFYISQNYVSAYLDNLASRRKTPTFEPVIDKYTYVKGTNYYYWNQSDEIRKHKKLFEGAEQILFIIPPVISEVDYVYTVNGNDTTNVEVLMRDGQLLIQIRKIGYLEEYTIDIDLQVFYMEKDALGLWVIRDWFDLGDAL